jgi:flagellar export protein FliJ
MKRFEFRLASVLRARKTTEDSARAQLSIANIALRSAIASRDTERHRAEALIPPTGLEPFTAFRQTALNGTLAAASHAAAQARVAEAAAAAAMAQIAWAGAAREVAILERLAERRREEHLEAERLADATALDDLVTARYTYERSVEKPGALR